MARDPLSDGSGQHTYDRKPLYWGYNGLGRTSTSLKCYAGLPNRLAVIFLAQCRASTKFLMMNYSTKVRLFQV